MHRKKVFIGEDDSKAKKINISIYFEIFAFPISVGLGNLQR